MHVVAASHVRVRDWGVAEGEAGALRRDPRDPGCAVVQGENGAQMIEARVGGDQARPAGKGVGVVHRDAFAPPQPRRWCRPLIAQRAVFVRMNRHEVPRVKQFVGQLRERRPRVPLQAGAADSDRHRRAVLQGIDGSILDQEVVLRYGRRAENVQGGGGQPPHFIDKGRGVEGGRVGQRPVDHVEPRAAVPERPLAPIAHEDRSVEQLGGARRGQPRRRPVPAQRRRNPPGLRNVEVERDGGSRKVRQVEEKVRAVDHGTAAPHQGPPCAYLPLGLLLHVNPVAHGAAAARQRDAPQRAVLANHPTAPLRGVDPHRVEVAPVSSVVLRVDFHRQAQRPGSIGDPNRDLNDVETGRVDAQGVLDRRPGVSAGDARRQESTHCECAHRSRPCVGVLDGLLS